MKFQTEVWSVNIKVDGFDELTMKWRNKENWKKRELRGVVNRPFKF